MKRAPLLSFKQGQVLEEERGRPEPERREKEMRQSYQVRDGDVCVWTEVTAVRRLTFNCGM